MAEQKKAWFIKGLGHRVDALASALRRLAEEPRDEEPVRSLAASLRASSQMFGFPAITEAARAAEDAPRSDLTAQLNRLIGVLRLEISGQTLPRLTVLITSKDAALNEGLRRALESRGKEPLFAATIEEADNIVQTRDIALIIIDLLLHSQDGRDLIARLRSRPMTTSIPIVAITHKPGDHPKEPQNLVPDLDAYFEKPVDCNALAEFVSAHLQRAHETPRAARRDSLTGLLNRAAFCEVFTEHMRSRPAPAEPATLAILGINRFEALSQGLTPTDREDVLRQIGAILSSAFRATDVVARWTVSEFAVLLPGEDHFGATRGIDKLMLRLGKQGVTASTGKTVPVALCAGLTVVTDPISVDEAAERADRYLYAAYFLSSSQSGCSQIVSDATKSVRRTERIALCMCDPTKTRIIKQLLERDSFEVAPLENAAAALQALSQSHFHLLIIDEDLPADGGFRILKEARAMAAYSRVPIVMLASSEDNVKRAVAMGANDYAIKPFPLLPFVTRMRRLLTHGEKNREPSRITVLVVDHEVSQLLIAGSALLKQMGCRILLARTGQAALKRLMEQQPEVVLLDAQMPDISAKDFLQRLPPKPRLKQTLFVPAVNAAGPPIKLTSDAYMVKDPVSKPYKPGTFLDEIRKILPEFMVDATPSPEAERLFDAEVQRELTT